MNIPSPPPSLSPSFRPLTRRLPAGLLFAGACACLALLLSGPDAAAQDSAAPGRTTEGLQLLYNFDLREGDARNLVRDRSREDGKDALDLKIADPKAVRWDAENGGSLEILKPVKIAGAKPAKRVAEAIRKSGEITLEAWVSPANVTQAGPARILTLSKNSSARNFTLGQDADHFQARLRTTETGTNGSKPALDSAKDTTKTRLSHVVYTRNRDGEARIYVDSKVRGQAGIKGDLQGWDEGFVLALGDEHGGQRAWLGTMHLVAVYDRALSQDEVRRHFEAGADAPATPAMDDARNESDARLARSSQFEKKIAPLLAEHCLECHDAASRKGKLDLSRPNPQHLSEGLIMTGANAANSLLWEMVESDEMPKDRDPLSKAEKQLLLEWLQGGAEWSLEVIDPVLYTHALDHQPVFVRRLTVDEYIETVRASLGVDIDAEARELLPPDPRADGFSNTAYSQNIDFKHIEAYSKLAGMIVEQMDVEKFCARFSKSQSMADDDKMQELVADMGRWVLRGPLNDDEIFAYRGVMTTVASAGGGFDEAAGYVVEAMLQSPRFIYRVESQLKQRDSWAVKDHELASRLSYLIWGGPPDERLMKSAEVGELSSDQEILRTHVDRMLADPRAVSQSLRFAEDWLNLRRLRNLRPDPDTFPNWKPELAEDMRAETLAFFEDVVWKQKQPMTALLNARTTFVTPRLAEHYNFPSSARPAPAEGKKDQLQQVSLKDVPGRGGLLTQGSVLTIGGDDASMVTRGLFVFHDLLRGVVKNPPPDLDITPVASKPGLSHRMIAEERVSSKTCGGCHAKFEPLAYGLEKFDGLGAWSERDAHGNDLREDGTVMIPGNSKPIPFQTAAELMDILASSDRVAESLTWKLTQFALGRQLTAADAPLVQAVHQKAVETGGGSYQATITALAMSDLVRRSFAPEEEKETASAK